MDKYALSRVKLVENRRALSVMMERFSEELSLDDLAEATGVSKFVLCRSFQREFSVTPIRWLWYFRTILAAEFIKAAPQYSLTDIAFACGFTASAHFSRSFRALFQQAPIDYRRRIREELANHPAPQASLTEFNPIIIRDTLWSSLETAPQAADGSQRSALY